MTEDAPKQTAKIINLFSDRETTSADATRIIRISPEYDNIRMLYANNNSPDQLFSLSLIGWGLQNNGEVVGLVPWLNNVTACPSLQDPLDGHWEGYLNPHNGDVFYEPPSYKKAELAASADFYHETHTQYAKETSDLNAERHLEPLQEIPDNIGTHAVFADHARNKFIIIDVFSWRLYSDGSIHGMLINKEEVQQTPVLVGDECLYVAQQQENFKYFFQYRIANKIKQRDPEALETIARLMDQ